MAEDPQGYVSAVALSPDWPAWLRLVLTRPMAYAATAGHTISRETLAELCRKDDPIIRLWALYALAVQLKPDPQTVVMIEKASKDGGPAQGSGRPFPVRSPGRGDAASRVPGSCDGLEPEPSPRGQPVVARLDDPGREAGPVARRLKPAWSWPTGDSAAP